MSVDFVFYRHRMINVFILSLLSFIVDTLFLKQCLSIVSSLGSLAYALSGYSRCWRHMQLTHSPEGWPKGKPAPQLVSWWSTIIQWVKKGDVYKTKIQIDFFDQNF